MRKKLSPSNYSFYATLIDSYEGYADAEISYEKYYGASEDPKYTVDEWEDKLKEDLLNRINRVPFESEAADRGTQFNNAIDFFVMGKLEDDKHKMQIDDKAGIISIFDPKPKLDAEGKQVVDKDGKPVFDYEKYYQFPLATVKEFADYYDGGLPQFFCKGTINTDYGDVDLYGYIDYLLPFKVCDLKTTKYYGGTGSFRRHFQHIIYPYCLHQMGIPINDFEYNILSWRDMSTHTELYTFKEDRDVQRIREACEGLIRFIEANKDVITDIKVFNLKEEDNGRS